ncbi:NAD(P)-binding domain-containing protein [Burkholderia multivorans]|uniref:NAD(P)-dependent oxidoreductase n=1 Tax=Burkholderia multivorans TaxID=87883 RepID=UPI0020A0728D|nr:NAD(P)-dependent oxidoreductase [Burkholderia multivorans]MCO8610779.1 NAD(P)-binding domain-containing protein [Burkholderia multivorans]MCO8635844.1 NAD(P)-binding domain-containing protein [Burkholderia multivorans]MCO8647660.1 NAD(P)-binding domain-containing protein [Burkholderia multivorans]
MNAPSYTASVPPRVLMVTGVRLTDVQRRLIAGRFAEVIEIVSPQDPEDIFSHTRNITDYILGGPEYIDAKSLARMPSLRRIALLGTGIPSFIDEAAARARDIKVINTPHVNAESVAEFALGAIILNAADAVASVEGVRQGSHWLQTPWRTLKNSRIGIIGLGHIGRALTRRLAALGVRNIAYAGRTRKRAFERTYDVHFMPVREMVAECHVISMHVNYSPETHHMIDATMFAACRPDLRLHCFSNPRTIDPAAARRALEQGKLAQIYMDGYYREWKYNAGKIEDHEGLLKLPYSKFLATSHLAAQSVHAINRQLRIALRRLVGDVQSE